MGINNRENFLGNSESFYDKTIRCQTYNRFFPKKLRKHPSELSGLQLFAWKHMVSIKNNELVVDYPKLPKKVKHCPGKKYKHEKPVELVSPF